MDDARTNGKGVATGTGSINYTNIIKERESNGGITAEIIDNIRRLGVPSTEFLCRYGVTDKLDLGFKVNSLFEKGINSKFQVLGNKTSGSAISIGVDFNQGLFGSSLAIPLYMSKHSKNNTSAYFNPRLIILNPANNKSGAMVFSKGFNSGLIFGGNAKFGFDIGLYHLSFGGKSGITYNLGIGWKIAIDRRNN
jgi:hypothetical protein